MAEQNPFAALLPTPESLDLRRRAQFLALSEGQDFWARQGGLSGLDLRKDLLSRGIGMTAEDRRAQNAQQIMSRAQQSLAELVRNGDLDPLDAQEEVIRKTMTEFMSVGDYEAAQSLLPGLNQVRMYREELTKLRSEATENQASAFRSTAEGETTYAKAPSEIVKNQAAATADMARAGQAEAAAYRERMHGDLYARTDPNLRAVGSGPKVADITPTEAKDVRAMGMGALNLFDSMYDLSTYMSTAPIVASGTAQLSNPAFQWLSGLGNLFKQKGASVGGFEALSSVSTDGREGVSPKSIVAPHLVEMRRKAVQLGFQDITAFESLVIDAAYALARSNDPGGRLSNNDFQFALDALGAVQDPTSALKAFRALAKRGYDKYHNMKSTYNKETWETNFADMDKEVETRYSKFEGEYGKSDIKEVAVAKDGWQTINGVRVRVKPTK